MTLLRWWLLMVLVATGCATTESNASAGRGRHLRMDRSSVPPPLKDAPTATSTDRSSDDARPDAWERLLVDAGLEERDALPLRGQDLSAKQAARLLATLLRKPVTRGTFPPRLTLCFMLREALSEGRVSWRELIHRVARFRSLLVLRPDGYLAWALDGRTKQRVGPVQWKDGSFRSGSFEVGRFYIRSGFVFHGVDARLQDAGGPPLAESEDATDYLSRAMDGAELAFVKLALAVGQLLTEPVESLAGLKRLPSAVVALLESSPEYFERFRFMTRGEQVQAVAELMTTLLSTCGAAGGTTRTLTGALAGTELSVPVLSLSAEGTLALERIALPVGRAVTVVGGGPGAAVVLQRANTSGPGKGPGQWGPSEESGASKRARDYQEQISGHSYDEAYWVGGVGRKSGGTKFDGFKDGVLLEAKGPGYAEFFEKNGTPKAWFKDSGKADEIIDQAIRQRDRVQGMGFSIEWHVAEEDVARAIGKLLRGNSVAEIQVIHTPALPR